MFAIRLLSLECRGPDGERLGEIVVDNFRERFLCREASGNPDKLEGTWRAELAGLVSGGLVAVLRHDPRFDWLVAREGDLVNEWPTNVAAIRQFPDDEPDLTA